MGGTVCETCQTVQGAEWLSVATYIPSEQRMFHNKTSVLECTTGSMPQVQPRVAKAGGHQTLHVIRLVQTVSNDAIKPSTVWQVHDVDAMSQR